MSLFGRAIILGVFVATFSLAACGQLQTEKACKAVAEGSRACVYKVDPPNWWVNMPSPMLLLYGRNLKNAQITLKGDEIAMAKTQFSLNGHYAIVWLNDTNQKPRNVEIRVASRQGTIMFPFAFESRKPASAGFQGFSAADTMYLIMTDRFADGDLKNDPQLSERSAPRGWHGGDFKGIEDHLSYLKQLGVTTIWITPAYDNSGETQAYHGYSATDMYNTDPHFGTVKDFQHLVSTVHAAGMKFVLDTVPNHVGPANPWANDPPKPEWFHGTLKHHDTAKGDFQSLPDPHATWQDQHDVTEGWFANVLPDLNQEDPIVSQYLIQNAIWWTEMSGLDGLRIDTFPYVGRAFWQRFNGELRDLYPRLTTVGEVFNSDPTITSFFAGGVARDGIDTHLWTPFDFPTYFAVRAVLTHKEPMSRLQDEWREDWLYPHPERLVPFYGNHDTMRFMSLPGVTVADLKLADGIVLTMRGMPEIYYGDELAMSGGDDPDNRHDFPGGFPGDTKDAFTPAGRTADQTDVHDWVAGLLRFRNAHPVFGNGNQQDIEYDATSIVYLRAGNLKVGCGAGDQDRVLVAVNDGEQPKTLKINPEQTALEGCTQFVPAAGTNAPVSLSSGALRLTLGAKQIGIYEVR